ncbi:MAG: helix-turn-helix domain-containing protein [Chamaesiphon sp. CSU_1_12]|nr:helix-turn-helix domain-containing protein [Chamaesiphon sp. CSU_1_12]
MTNTTQPFAPDWISPPGETIADLLEERNWTQTQLAECLGYSEVQVCQLINGEMAISTEIADKLVEIFGSTVDFWLKLEAIYRSQLAKTLTQEQQITDTSSLKF